MTSITVPDSVTSIGDSAFEACWVLTSVTFLGAPPTVVGSSAFPTTNFKARAGFGSSFLGIAVTQEMRIKSTSMDASNNLRIETDALNTTGLKVFHSTSLNSPFNEVTGVTKEGEGTVPFLPVIRQHRAPVVSTRSSIRNNRLPEQLRTISILTVDCSGVPSTLANMKESSYLPEPKSFIAYHRVSTHMQGESGLSLEAQELIDLTPVGGHFKNQVPLGVS